MADQIRQHWQRRGAKRQRSNERREMMWEEGKIEITIEQPICLFADLFCAVVHQGWQTVDQVAASLQQLAQMLRLRRVSEGKGKKSVTKYDGEGRFCKCEKKRCAAERAVQKKCTYSDHCCSFCGHQGRLHTCSIRMLISCWVCRCSKEKRL